MILENKFQDLILNASIKAALSSFYLVGKKNKIAADKAAVDAMRSELNKIDMVGKVVIGEGQLATALWPVGITPQQVNHTLLLLVLTQ